MNLVLGLLCTVISGSWAVGYPVEGRILPAIIDLSNCNHRTKLASTVKNLALEKSKRVPNQVAENLRSLTNAIGLSVDQLGLITGALLLIERGAGMPSDQEGAFWGIALSFLQIAKEPNRPYAAVINMFFRMFEEDYVDIFGSKSVGYQFLIRLVIACHMPQIPEEAREMMILVFTDLMSSKKSTNKDIQERFSAILDGFLALDKGDPVDLLEQLHALADKP